MVNDKNGERKHEKVRRGSISRCHIASNRYKLLNSSDHRLSACLTSISSASLRLGLNLGRKGNRMWLRVVSKERACVEVKDRTLMVELRFFDG